jgi:hypothetical protein
MEKVEKSCELITISNISITNISERETKVGTDERHETTDLRSNMTINS